MRRSRCGVDERRLPAAADLEKSVWLKWPYLPIWFMPLVVPLSVDVVQGGDVTFEINDLVVLDCAQETKRDCIRYNMRQLSAVVSDGIEDNECPVALVTNHIKRHHLNWLAISYHRCHRKAPFSSANERTLSFEPERFYIALRIS